ncbi:Cellulose synthase [Corchorus olitorius]|uniref:Cellulose synthase n=1 Tax=Corchorus olitorius TaxID=93759 RepID=A0A1R3KB02_9ROSI|nr:Cellulose synthase [Corchorus olitorius]
MGNEGYFPLFETKKAKGIALYRVFAASVFVGICGIWAYRVSNLPRNGEDGRWVWIGLFAAEIWLGFYWLLTQALRWNPIYRHTFKDRLSRRYVENELPGVDIFVCTADPVLEPPMMVINTVLSVMAYDYPKEKLSVYLSDDAGSYLTFYALLEASQFAKYWIPFCKKFNVEPRSPAAYFKSSISFLHDTKEAKELATVKKLYQDMEDRIEVVAKLGHLSEDLRLKHKGFSHWDSYVSQRDHDTVLQILIDGKDPISRDVEGCRLPNLVYLAREKRPQHFHNFKAGAMNALIRVSSKISNGQIILNVDCDMYSNNSHSVRDALCFFMDEKKGSEIAYVQFPQNFDNITKNEIYSNSMRVINEVEFHGLDGYGGPLYIGTGCFHRRDTLCGRKFSPTSTNEFKIETNVERGESIDELEENSKVLANCSYEENTKWGDEIGLKYGCPVEDVITGLSIQSRGWKSVYYNPARKAFLGVATTTLGQTLVQHKRWSEGDFQILLSKYGNDELPGVDIFVCTADPAIEPPLMVVNTVLSVMAYDYPPEKLSVYLSDDAGSQLTFYALLEASHFAKYWVPFCKKFNVEPRSPAAYFDSISNTDESKLAKELTIMKKLYEDMKNQIENAVKLGRIPEEIQLKHKGFPQWESYSSRNDHDTIVQILIDGKDPNAKDIEGCVLPTLVYLAREKRPQYPHNFKAGAMNSLIRVSSEISNGQIILNVDCDMYSNDSVSMRDALCFLMDEKMGHEIAYVQFSQNFDNETKNGLYGSLRVIGEVEFHGIDGYGGPLYVGSGCFHRRDALCGRKFSREITNNGFNIAKDRKRDETAQELEQKSKILASCTYEENTEWGKEMGLKYGCPVEDVITGLAIQCRGWKSVYLNPERKAFLGVAPTTLAQTLVQHKRWSEGDFQILLSKYCPVWYGHGKISLGLQLGYCCYCFWASNCLAVLYYSIFPSLYLLQGIPLFPKCSSPWFLPFAYVAISKYGYSLAEFLWSGGTILGWWNDQRMWLYKRTSSYLFAFVDTIAKTLGLNSDLAFVITPKVSEQEVYNRYVKEIMEFGASSPMFTTLATIALMNLVCFAGLIMKQLVVTNKSLAAIFETMALQMKIGSLAVILLALLCSLNAVYGIRFVIDREECFSHNVKYEGDTIHVSFVVIKTDSSWHSSHEGVDLVVKGPSGDQIQDYRDKISEKFEFVARQKGVHRFCFKHFNPLLEQISKLEEALYNIQFEQHWLEAQTERQAIVNEAMSKRAVHKAFYESAALIGASVLQVYLLRRLFERKLGMSRV